MLVLMRHLRHNLYYFHWEKVRLYMKLNLCFQQKNRRLMCRHLRQRHQVVSLM
jgi:hypothetical protein